MQLDEKAIEEFKKLYLQEYGIKLTKQEAVEYGMRLIQLIKAVYGSDLPKLKTLDTGTKKEDN